MIAYPWRLPQAAVAGFLIGTLLWMSAQLLEWHDQRNQWLALALWVGGGIAAAMLIAWLRTLALYKYFVRQEGKRDILLDPQRAGERQQDT